MGGGKKNKINNQNKTNPLTSVIRITKIQSIWQVNTKEFSKLEKRQKLKRKLKKNSEQHFNHRAL